MSIEWFKNAVIYQILIDRFAGVRSPENWDKPEFIGGNLRGIIDKLNYIRDLGVNTLWVSPFYQTDAYHGYHITDFFKTEPRFGTVDDLRELIDKVHQAGMKIIADFVPNHCSRQHPFFKDAQTNRNSPYHDWFIFKKWPQQYLCFLSVRQLPKLNLQNAAARAHIIEAAKHWLSFGLDGFRLDHCIGPTHDFWREFRRQIKSDFPNCVLIGEAWLMGIRFRELKTVNVRHKFRIWMKGQAPEELYREYIGELDGVLDFKFQCIMQDFVRGKISRQTALRKCRKHFSKFPPEFHLPTFLDNHDMDRFLFVCGRNKDLLKAAAEIQFLFEQPKVIYYGTETGLSQDKSLWDFPAHGDLQARKPMDWDNPDTDLLSFYKNLLHR